MPKFGTKNDFLGIFGLEFQKTIVIFEISTLKFVKNESLTHTVDFDIGPAFSKGSRFVFSEGLGPGQGLGMLLYTATLHTGNWCFWFKWKQHTDFAL